MRMIFAECGAVATAVRYLAVLFVANLAVVTIAGYFVASSARELRRLERRFDDERFDWSDEDEGALS